MEQDRDKLFDHEYDGIREYDNPMPKWWLYIYLITFIICFPYILYYHFGDGPSVHDATTNPGTYPHSESG